MARRIDSLAGLAAAWPALVVGALLFAGPIAAITVVPLRKLIANLFEGLLLAWLGTLHAFTRYARAARGRAPESVAAHLSGNFSGSSRGGFGVYAAHPGLGKLVVPGASGEQHQLARVWQRGPRSRRLVGVAVRKDDVYRQFAELPEDDQWALASKILEDLHGPLDADSEQAWVAEIDRRLDDLDAGNVKTSPWEEVDARMQRMLDAKKR